MYNVNSLVAVQESFAVSFVKHYTYMSVALVNVLDKSRMSNCVVHVSVQLFSPRNLALKLVSGHHLLHIMLFCLDYMLDCVLTEADTNGQFICLSVLSLFICLSTCMVSSLLYLLSTCMSGQWSSPATHHAVLSCIYAGLCRCRG